MQLSDGARLFFIGLISNADDDGRGSAVTRTLAARIFPSDGSERITAIEGYKQELVENTHTIFYEAEGSPYYALLKWKDYQKIDHYHAGACPEPDLRDQAKSYEPAKPEADLFKEAVGA